MLALRLPFDSARWSLVSQDLGPAGGESVVPLYQQGQVDGDRPALTAVRDETLAASQLRLQLWRGACHAPFTEAEAGMLQCLMPHLVDLWRESRFSPHNIGTGTGTGASAARRCRALCDRQGRVQQVDDSFMALLRLEWPRGPAAGLPLVLRRWVVAAAAAQGQVAPSCLQGRRIIVGLQTAGDVLQLDLRRRASVDRLSSHQRDIAQRYAAGRSGPQIATELGLSPSTISNHLSSIFRRLGVGNKLQLALLLRETTGWP